MSGCDVASAHAFAAAYGFDSPCDGTGWTKLVGRARLTAKFVVRLLRHAGTSDDWDEHLETVFEIFTRDIAAGMTDRVNSDMRVHRTTAQLPPVSYQQLAIDLLLLDIKWRNGIVTQACHEVVEFIDHGI